MRFLAGAVTSFAPNPSPLPGGVALCCLAPGSPLAFDGGSVKVGAADGTLFAVAATPVRGAPVRARAAQGKAESDEERAARAAEGVRLMQERARALAEARREALGGGGSDAAAKK